MKQQLGQKISLITEKQLHIAAALPAAVCEQLQLLPTYFDVTRYTGQYGIGLLTPALI